jgi:hypothetical protein
MGCQRLYRHVLAELDPYFGSFRRYRLGNASHRRKGACFDAKFGDSRSDQSGSVFQPLRPTSTARDYQCRAHNLIGHRSRLEISSSEGAIEVGNWLCGGT